MATIMLKSQSAEGIISIMNESDEDMQIYALNKLSLIVDQTWPEIANHLSLLESLSSNHDFPEHQLAAYVASKVFYHLQEPEFSVKLALESGEKFNIMERSQYVDTVISKCIDMYIEQKVKMNDDDMELEIDKNLEDIVNKMFER